MCLKATVKAQCYSKVCFIFLPRRERCVCELFAIVLVGWVDAFIHTFVHASTAWQDLFFAKIFAKLINIGAIGSRLLM